MCLVDGNGDDAWSRMRFVDEDWLVAVSGKEENREKQSIWGLCIYL